MDFPNSLKARLSNSQSQLKTFRLPRSFRLHKRNDTLSSRSSSRSSNLQSRRYTSVKSQWMTSSSIKSAPQTSILRLTLPLALVKVLLILNSASYWTCPRPLLTCLSTFSRAMRLRSPTCQRRMRFWTRTMIAMTISLKSRTFSFTTSASKTLCTCEWYASRPSKLLLWTLSAKQSREAT